MRAKSSCVETNGVHAISVTDCDRTTGGHWNGRTWEQKYVPVKIVTDVEDDGTSEDGSTRPGFTYVMGL